jgi:hypothetical protein
MRKKNYCHCILVATLAILAMTACEKDSVTVSQIKDFISLANDDGYIENFPTRVVHSYYIGPQGQSLNTGWNGSGQSMRSFLSFDVSDIMPPADKELVIDEAVLKVYEANTNMHPFDGAGVRVVNCYLLYYGNLEKTDYDLTPFADCGTTSTWGYNVLKEYPLKVTSFLNSFHQANPSITKFQFRLQFVPDGNVTPPSPLTSSMWSIFAGDETAKSDYRPTLTIKYHYRDR